MFTSMDSIQSIGYRRELLKTVGLDNCSAPYALLYESKVKSRTFVTCELVPARILVVFMATNNLQQP